jgi:hypothetical protein
MRTIKQRDFGRNLMLMNQIGMITNDDRRTLIKSIQLCQFSLEKKAKLKESG